MPQYTLNRALARITGESLFYNPQGRIQLIGSKNSPSETSRGTRPIAAIQFEAIESRARAKSASQRPSSLDAIWLHLRAARSCFFIFSVPAQ